MDRKFLGISGGMRPLAAADFLPGLVKRTPACIPFAASNDARVGAARDSLGTTASVTA